MEKGSNMTSQIEKLKTQVASLNVRIDQLEGTQPRPGSKQGDQAFYTDASGKERHRATGWTKREMEVHRGADDYGERMARDRKRRDRGFEDWHAKRRAGLPEGQYRDPMGIVRDGQGHAARMRPPSSADIIGSMHDRTPRGEDSR